MSIVSTDGRKAIVSRLSLVLTFGKSCLYVVVKSGIILT